jgi:hypothetical protein
VVVVIAGMVGALVVLDDPPSQEQVQTDDPPPDPAAWGPAISATVTPSQNGLELYGDSPLSPRNDAAVIAAGDVVVVWGGSIEGANVGRPELGFETFDDGAFLDLASGTWRAMSPAPLPRAVDVRPVGIWTGEEVLVFRGAHAAAWDPSSDTWRSLPAPPDRVTQVFWTGEEVIALGADATYHVGDDGWNALPDGPVEPTELLGGEAVAAAWTGDELIVLSKSASDRADAAAFDPESRSWRALPPAEFSYGSTAVGVAWTGDELVAVGYERDVVALDPRAERWRTLAALPVPPQEGVPRLLTVDGLVVVERFPGIGILDGDEWTVIPADPFPSSSPAPGPNGTVLTFGLSGTGESVLGVFDPRRALAELSSIQVGYSSLTLDETSTLAEMLVDDDPATITATVITPDGDCTVSHDLSGPFAPASVNCSSISASDRLRSQLTTPGL